MPVSERNTVSERFQEVPSRWKRQHLLGLEGLSAEELTLLLDYAQSFRDEILTAEGTNRKIPLLGGKAIVNLFFENSTRTRTSFSLAGRRLGPM